MQTTSENDIVVGAPCAFGCPGHRPANGCTVVALRDRISRRGVRHCVRIEVWTLLAQSVA